VRSLVAAFLVLLSVSESRAGFTITPDPVQSVGWVVMPTDPALYTPGDVPVSFGGIWQPLSIVFDVFHVHSDYVVPTQAIVTFDVYAVADGADPVYIKSAGLGVSNTVDPGPTIASDKDYYYIAVSMYPDQLNPYLTTDNTSVHFYATNFQDIGIPPDPQSAPAPAGLVMLLSGLPILGLVRRRLRCSQ